jgi:hypothetical protein
MNKVETLKAIENESKVLFTNWCNQQQWCKVNRWSKKTFTSWDVSLYSADTAGNEIKVLAELKYRYNDNASTYQNWLLKQTKYDSLKTIADENEALILYINITKDKQIMIWNLNEVVPPKQTIQMKLATSTNERNGLHYKLTNVYLLNKNETIYNTQL